MRVISLGVIRSPVKSEAWDWEPLKAVWVLEPLAAATLVDALIFLLLVLDVLAITFSSCPWASRPRTIGLRANRPARLELSARAHLV
jgi:hypothetical protein